MPDDPIIGRFAPTPSGPLHFGSLVTALASYCDTRSRNGQWLLRIDDVDTPRVVAGADTEIIRALEAFGFEWDANVVYQHDQFEHYRDTLQYLLDQGDCYACECSRRGLRQLGVDHGPMGLIYPGYCRDKHLDPALYSIRMHTGLAGNTGFHDRIFGLIELNLGDQVGDFVLRRIDGIYAYHLAAVLDDARLGVNSVLRGADLLESSCLQIFLQQRLGLPQPEYIHVPLVKNQQGQKLSKQAGATALDINNAGATLISALEFLGQPIDATPGQTRPREIIDYAVQHWDRALINSG